jgi:hypothetical protein
MNRRRRDRTSRAAGVIAVNVERRFAMKEEVARAMSALVQMRRQAEEFSWKAAPLSPLKSTGLPACNGTGHAGAI